MAKSNHGKDSLELIALPKNILPSNLEKVYHGTSVGASSPKAVSDSLSPRLKQFPGLKIIASKEASLTSRGDSRTLRKGRCIAILDSKSREAEIDLLFLVASFSPLSLKTLKTKAKRELYIFVAHEVICTFGFPFIGECGMDTLNFRWFLQNWCFMLCKDGDDFGALPPKATKAWVLGKNIPFLIGLYIINVFQGGARS
ncbi:unnamed protein product [Sphagnum jensenii]|uniref:Uncharacterized protein n=1 Tax=Sphagnum jensenii TaxID=128206 RepID=A0ABP1C1W3_9BRYO